MNRLRGLAAIAAAAVLFLNLLIERALTASLAGKVLLPGLLEFRPAWNRGVSFSLFWQDSDGGRYFLSAILILAVLGMAVLAWRATSAANAVGLGLIIGGALGNLVDRSRFGAVFDYLFVHLGTLSLFVCNFADIAISAGVLLLAGSALVKPQST